MSDDPRYVSPDDINLDSLTAETYVKDRQSDDISEEVIIEDQLEESTERIVDSYSDMLSRAGERIITLEKALRDIQTDALHHLSVHSTLGSKCVTCAVLRTYTRITSVALNYPKGMNPESR